MHPALLILLCVLATSALSAVGHARITSLLSPLYLRLFHARAHAHSRAARAELLRLRLELGGISAQDDFAKWAKMRRRVDKLQVEAEAGNASTQAALSFFALLIRAGMLLATTVFPFVLTTYYGKTPMFFLPPARPNAPEGTTWLGPIGWVLSLTAAPAVSAGVWSTVVTRVLGLAIGAVASVSKDVQGVRSKRAAAQAGTAAGAEGEKAGQKSAVGAGGKGEKKMQ
ncbi:hypothetical protein FA09DRAFT_341166 [Tilletiopsis washingtonensis]|uniref:Guided entry of tail-anchored proteins 1 n=1 Tax=Tilletiopsis washingtonensis TaxID=58919 RepID=A0A316Z5V1_9BASI|nr:hypothetical protein FA09DRAFT_341166 [Tilletiopsis washingtonensis]PWN95523.1 hypothetical protein FA09DRAFT_341166 [Tilletiopsis washingtonensis]